jgi:hypothetical protein
MQDHVKTHDQLVSEQLHKQGVAIHMLYRQMVGLAAKLREMEARINDSLARLDQRITGIENIQWSLSRIDDDESLERYIRELQTRQTTEWILGDR